MTALSKSEMQHLQALRAKNLANKVRPTVATFPEPEQSPLAIMAARCFTANLNASDLRYMAMALLQMNDELCELRERVRILEARKE